MQQVILSGVLYTQLLDDLRALVRGEVQNTLCTSSKPVAEPAEQLLTVREASVLLSICPQTVHEYKRKGILPFHKLSGRTYLKRSDVLAALQGYQRTTKSGKGTGRG
jgi:excisionase family DNA binding protein